ncbi:MAG: hypothetical protein ABSG89_01965 [Bacteroidales bacterium]|jgi:hypothetical protein
MDKKRLDHEPPRAISEWGWRYHHIGIPTNEPIPGGTYLEEFRLSTEGFSASPYGIEWMHYDADSPVDDLVKRVPHVAFEVDDLDLELKLHSLNIITLPNSPGTGTRVAMIEHNGAPVELIEFKRK